MASNSVAEDMEEEMYDDVARAEDIPYHHGDHFGGDRNNDKDGTGVGSADFVAGDSDGEETVNQLIHRNVSVDAKNQNSITTGDDEFACSVCLQLSVLPTTLTCGHTSCRFCLAQWYFSSKKKECPMCKAAYQGHPKMNTQLRNMLTRLYPHAMEEREKEVYSSDMKTVIEKYDKALQAETVEPKKDFKSFFSGMLVAGAIFLVIYLAWYWRSHDDSLLIRKRVSSWSPSDVETWMGEIAWANQYAPLAREKQIDGRLLLSVEEGDLVRLFNITEGSHAKALMFLVTELYKAGVKMPMNLWEYKAVYPGRSLFLVFGLKDFPRTTMLYLWLYFREEMFNPLVVATQRKYDPTLLDSDGIGGPDYLDSSEPFTREVIWFWYYVLFLPDYIIGTVAHRLMQYHTFTPLFVFATLLCRLMLEGYKVSDMIRNRSFRYVLSMLKQHCKELTSAFIFMVLWPIIPRFICDVFFYCALYLSPFQMASTILNRGRQQPA